MPRKKVRAMDVPTQKTCFQLLRPTAACPVSCWEEAVREASVRPGFHESGTEIKNNLHPWCNGQTVFAPMHGLSSHVLL
ncbi:MAG: hypothetical protein AAFZ15_14550 [Bacteroidota bacterium]